MPTESPPSWLRNMLPELQRRLTIVESTPEERRKEARVALTDVMDTIPWALGRGNSDARFDEVASQWRISGPNLMFTGKSGTGKSSAMVRIIRRLVLRGIEDPKSDDYMFCRRIRWFGAKDICAQKIDDVYTYDRNSIVEKAKSATLLVISDLGKERALNGMWNVIDHRYERAYPTFITSEMSVGEMFDRYDDSLTRRFMESGGVQGTIVEVG